MAAPVQKRAATTALAMLFLGTACSGSGDGGLLREAGGPDGAPPGSAPVPLEEFDPPLAFDAASSVDLPGGSVTRSMGGTLHDHHITLHGATAYVASEVDLQAVSAVTGQVEWSVPFNGAVASDSYSMWVSVSGPRPPAVSDDGTTVYAATRIDVPGAGSTPGHSVLSVVAVEAATGDLLQSTEVPIPPDLLSGDEGLSGVAGVRSGRVIVSWNRDERCTTCYLVALDEENLDLVWDRYDIMPIALVDEMVVGHNSGTYDGTRDVIALDLATGNVTTEHEVGGATLWPTHSDRVAARWRDPDSGDLEFGYFEPATGELVTVAEGDRTADCLPDDESSTLVCFGGHWGSDWMTAYDAETFERLWRLPDDGSDRIPPRRLHSAAHGTIYADDEEGTPYAIDARTGEDVAVAIGVAPFLVSTTHGVWVDGDGPHIAPAVG